MPFPKDQDLLPAFENFDLWSAGLPENRRALVENHFKFTAPEDLEEERRHFLSVALISQRTGHDAEEVSRNLDTLYIPAFSKDERGLNLSVLPKDAGEFYQQAKSKLAGEKDERDTFNEGFQSAMRGEDVVPALQAWQQKNGLERMPKSTAFTKGFLHAQESISGFGVSDAVDAHQRAMQGAPKEGDEEMLRDFEALLLDLPEAKRKTVLTAAAMMAQARSEKAVKGIGARESGPMGGAGSAINAVTGFFQEVGESGGRFAGKLGGIAKDEELDVMANLPALPVLTDAAKARHPLATGVAYTSTEKIDTAEKAADFIKEWKVTNFGTASADVTRADIEESDQTAKKYRQLDDGEKKLIESAQKRELKKNQIARELRAIAESSDPVGPISGAIGSSVAMAAANILTRGKTLPISWQLYSEANYDQLRLENPSLAPSEARAISRVSGAGEAALDALEIGILRKLPSVAAVLKSGTSAAWRNAGTRLGATFAFEQFQEGVQDLTLPFTRALFEAVGRDTGLDMTAEWERWKDSRGTVAIASIPLILLGAGIATHQDIKDAKNSLSSRDRLGEQGIGEADAVPIIEAARAGKMDEAQALYRDAFKRRSPEVAAEYQAKLETQQKAVAEAVVEVTRLGLIPEYTLLPGGKVVVTDLNDGSKATFDSWRDAQPVIEQSMNEMERLNNDSILRIADDILQRGEEVTVSPRSSESLADRVRGGSMSPEEAIRAAIAANIIKGVSVDEARKIAEDVFGESREERIKVMRDAVERSIVLGSNVTQGGESKSKLFKGANLTTLIEETSEGRLKEGLRLGRYKKNDWLRLIQQAEEATGEKFLIGSTSDAVNASPDFAPRELVEAVSRIVVADVLGRLKDGRRIGSGSITKSLEENNSLLVAWIRAFKRLLASVLHTAKKIGEARKLGKLGDEYDAYIDDLLGVDQQAKHETAVADAVAAEMATPAVDQTAGARGSDSTNADGGSIPSVAATAGGSIKSDNESRRKSETPDPIYSEENPGPNGETFSVRVTPAQDAEYMAAVESGDVAKQQAMVDEAAKAAPLTTEGYESDNPLVNAIAGDAGVASLLAEYQYDDPDSFRSPSPELNRLKDYLARSAPVKRTLYRGATDRFPNGISSWTTDLETAEQFAKDNGGEVFSESGLRAVSIYGVAGAWMRRNRKSWYSGGQSEWIAIKSADPITRDESGQIIPLSQRFNPESNEITFSLRKFPVPPGLAEAAQKARGESSLILAYQAAQRGSSSVMVPIKAVYEAAKKHSPALTPAAFMAQINALNESGSVLIGLSETTKAVEDAGAFRVGAAGTEMAFVPQETFSLAEPSPGGLSEAEVRKGGVFTLYHRGPAGFAFEAPMFFATQDIGPSYGSELKQASVTIRKPAQDSDVIKAAATIGIQKRGLKAYEYLSPNLMDSPLTPRDTERLMDELERQGFDGAVVKDSDVPFSVIPFTTSQIRAVNPESSRAAGGTSYSLRSGDFASRMAAAFSPFQRNPELRMAIAQVAKQRAQKIGAEWIEKAAVIRGAGDIGKESRMREALAYEARMNEYLDGLTPNARQTLEFEPAALEDDPLIAAMLDHGKLMSRTTARKLGKVEAKSGDYDGAPWLPPAWYSKGAGIMPDQMAQAMHDAGLLPDAYTDTLWKAIASRIASTKKDKAAHREAVTAYKAAQKYARDASRAESEQWAEKAAKKAGSPKAQREALKAALRTLDGILSAAPPEVRAKVGGYVKLAGLATDEAMLQEIERRIAKLNVELEKWLKKEGVAEIQKLLKRGRPDAKSGKRGKGKDADMHALFAAAERAIPMTAEAVAGELARLDALIGGDALTPEQEALAITERGIVELAGDLKSADSGRVFSALDSLREIYEGGWLKWKLAQIEKREERAGMRGDFIADTGKSGVKPERDAADKAAVTLLGKIKGGFLSLSSFHEVLAYAFGSKSDRVKALVDAEREASGQYEDVTQSLADEVESLFSELAGGSVLAGERLRFDMSQRTIQTGKGDLSQLEAIQALLMWRQEDGRRHMEGAMDENGKPIGPWNYDQAWIDEITAALTPEARSVMAWLSQKYAAEHPALNALYRERYGVNMPAHDNYAPITVQPVQTKSGEVNDPVSGAAISSGSVLVPGSLRARSRSAIAEPDFRDSLQTFMAHTRQLEYWKAYYDLAFEASAILGNREVLNAVKAKGGEPAATALRKWIDAIAQGGFRDASATLGLHKLLSRMTGRAASVGLLGRFSTLLVQSTQLGAASVKMPVGAYLVRLSKLLTGNLSFRDAVNSPFIQRRYKSAPPIVRQALEGLGVAFRPNQITRATRHLGNLLSGADAMFTAGTYAMLLDYHRGTGQALGLSGAELETHAHTEAERDTEAVAQPTRMATRSLAELTSTNPLAKVSWAYASEARQKIALMAWATMKATAEPAQFAKTAFLVFGVGGLMTQILKNLWREAKGDDDEKKWSPERLALSAMAGPLHGVPLASELMGNQGMLSGVAWAWPALKDIASGEGDMRDVDTLLSAAGLFNDTAAGVAALSHVGLDAAKLLTNLASEK